MGIVFNSKLVNGHYGDPSLYIELSNRREAFLFDCGELFPLSISELIKISKIFISHTHLDHFIGFSQVLRANVGREKEIEIYGYDGITHQVINQLKGYSWNIEMDNILSFKIFEIKEDRIDIYLSKYSDKFDCKKIEIKKKINPLFEDDEIIINFVKLDHKIPSLAYSIQGKLSYNVDKDKLKELNLPSGSWIRQLKESILKEGHLDEIIIDGKKFSILFLKEKLIYKNEGMKISFVTDTIYNELTKSLIVNLVKNSDIFYCESNFINADIIKAKETYHLTTSQTGTLAREAGVKELVPFHFSRKYNGNYDKIFEELKNEFNNVRRL